MEEVLIRRVAEHKNKFLYRQRYARGLEDSVEALNFSSNDYLGMSKHPAVVSAFQKSAEVYGVSGSSSHIVSGYRKSHQALELAFAEFLNREAALLFSSGYMANLGLLSVLANRQDCIFADKFIHASLIDAVKLSQAKLLRFQHRDYAQLSALFNKHRGMHNFVVTDSVFSMQGDLADLPALVTISKQHHAPLIVDDAHGIGVLGTRGAGVCEFYQLSQQDVPFLVCPLAKAFGVMGAIVAGSKATIDALIQFARPYIYTNALPPALAAAGLASLVCVEKETWRRDKLNYLIRYFRQGAECLALPLTNSITPIQPIIIGSSKKAVLISEALRQAGFILHAMRPPTVPENLACLRVTLTCLHEEKDIDLLLQTIKKIYDNL